MTMSEEFWSTLVFYVNGKKLEENNANPEWTLLYYLRNKLGLCGTKLGCGEGGCGACTVMVSRYDRALSKPVHMAVNACLAPVCSMHGLAITTIEGIGNTRNRLHTTQERIARAHGSQCGFCTPGIVMSMYTLLRNKSKPNEADLETAFQGNLCRCTGYRPILEAYRTFTEEWQDGIKNKNISNKNVCALGAACCKNDDVTNGCNDKLFQHCEFTPYDSTQEPIFPPELVLNNIYDDHRLKFTGPDVTWYRPTSMYELLKLKELHPDAKIVVGNTEIGVEVKVKRLVYPVLIQPTLIQELISITKTNSGLVIGSSVTLQQLEDVLNEEIKNQPEYMTRIFVSIVDMLYWFAGKQIRNVAAIGGNIMTCSPISDLNPIFTSAECKLQLRSTHRTREVTMDGNFYTGYRKNIIEKDEVLISITIPYTHENQYFCAFKQARRRDDDIAIVNTAINVEFSDDSAIINDIRLSFGGMAPTTVVASKTRGALVGKHWNREMLEIANSSLLEDLPLSPNAPGGMIQYRRALTLSLFFKAYLVITEKYNEKHIDTKYICEKEKSGGHNFEYISAKNSQYFTIISDSQKKTDDVGRPIIHKSAFKQATGEAVYCDDMPAFKNELYLSLVTSTRPNAKIVSINPEEALSTPGVHLFLSAKDLTDHQNHVGPIFHDEELFASQEVHCQGQIIGAVVADDQSIAQKAARKIQIEYEEIKPVIISIEDAINEKSYFPNYPKVLTKGDIDTQFKTAEHIIEGECRLGAQEHFYLETHCAIAVPKNEDNEIEIFASSQNPYELSKLVAHLLDVPINRIVTKVKRIGGGFGGKESRGIFITLPVALAAHKLNRPVRCMLDRDEDMLITGTRNPFLLRYKTAFDKDGTILACQIHIYCNAGHSYDLSSSVLERAMFHFQNAYLIPNVKVYGYLCRTNLPSNTAFRGFGGPQGMFAAENMIRDIAEKLGKDALEICKLNLYKEGDLTHYNQKFTHCTLSRCMDECLEMSNYYKRKRTIELFNRQNRWKKRGISIVPTAFGIAFTATFLNQAGALIHVYTDGSVLLSHGGTEMGQGLHTKMIQVASRVLGICSSKIHIAETATDKVPNTSATAASAGSDLNGMAVIKACETIMERLEPYKNKNSKGSWEEWISAAYFDRISLSATGFYKTPNIGYDWSTNSGKPFNYYTYGVACSEVEIDCLNGDHRVLRTDIVMDLGESLNPAIDIGQIEGAFMQGYGLFTLEEMVYSPNGNVFTRGPGAYKLPGFADIPIEFNVSLLKGAPNPRAVYSSKAVGEPPLFLASSTLFAIREAIKSARADAGVTDHFRLNAPATAARIRMACIDHITSKLVEPNPSTYIPWNVVP